MLCTEDFFVLEVVLTREIQRLLPFPLTVSYEAVVQKNEILPYSAHRNFFNQEENKKPLWIDDDILVPVWINQEELVVITLTGKDSALIKKISKDWLIDFCNNLVEYLNEIRFGYVAPETGLYNKRAIDAFLRRNNIQKEDGYFFFLKANIGRRSAFAMQQKNQETADLLKALIGYCCFSLGTGLFLFFKKGLRRSGALQCCHALQKQLKRERFNKIQITCAPLPEDQSFSPDIYQEQLWRGLAVAEKRGPFGIYDVNFRDSFSHRQPFLIRSQSILRLAKKQWRNRAEFSLLAILLSSPCVDAEQQLVSCESDDPITIRCLGRVEQQVWFFLGTKDHAQLLAFIQKISTLCSGATIAVASWPCLDFRKSEILGNCLKCVAHAQLLGPARVVFFDHVSLNVSGDVYFEEGDYRSALRDYRHGLQLDPEDVNLMNSLGVTLVEYNQERKAAVCFQEVLRKDPKNCMALVNLGYVQQTLGLKKEALRCFEEASRGCLDDVANEQEILLPLGKLYLEFDQPERAVAIFERWRNLPGGDQEILVHRLLGQAYLAMGEGEKAIQACQQALHLFPQDSVSLSILGLLYLEQGEGKDVGLSLCQQAITLDGYNPDHWYRLGRAMWRIEEFDEAKKAARQCLQFYSRHVEGLVLLGKIYLAFGKLQLAEKYFLKAGRREFLSR